MRSWLWVLLVLGPAFAWGQETVDAQKLQLERLRAEVADQVQFKAYDLLDELVLAWKAKPVFELDTPVVLAEVSSPVGFGTGLTALIENHFIDVLLKNGGTHLVPSHCPACTAMVVHSGPKGTVLARGVDTPEALTSAGLASGAKYALFLDFEIEGAALVLRARITALTPELPIVAARTLTTTTSSAALLRAGEHLKSADEARAEYLEAINPRGIFVVPVKLGIQTFSPPSGQPVQAAPMVWVQSGLEVSLTRARGWVASVLAGFTWAPQTYVGWSLQARIERLLGVASSLTTPDAYIFLGGGLFTLYGMGALALKDRIPTADDVALALQPGREPSQSVGVIQLGFELRIKNRVGAAFYIESAPWLDTAPAIGRLIDLGIIRFHSFGVEVSFWF